MAKKEWIKVGAAVVAASAVYGGTSFVVQAEEVADAALVDNANENNIDGTSNNECNVVVDISDDIDVNGENSQLKLNDGWDTEQKSYVVDGKYVTSKFQEIDGNTYYFDEYGYKVTGDTQINGTTYSFDENGVLVVEDVDNSITTLELTSNERATVISGMKKENGKLYFYSNGSRVYGDQTADGKVYNFRADGTVLKGFLENGTSLKYYNDSGVRMTGEFTVDKVTYYADSNGEIYKSVINGVPYYCQQSGSWAWSVVGGYYFRGTGCVPTTATMIVNTLKGTNYTPLEVGNTLHAHGYFNVGEAGTSSNVWRFVASNYGLTYTNSLNYNTAYQKLKEGNFVTGAVGYGSYWCPWVGTTHQILMFGIDQDGYTNVYDPYTSSRNGRFKLSDIFAHPATAVGDLVDGGPFFSLGSTTTNSLYNYSITSSGVSHVGNKYYTGSAVEPEVNLSVKGNGLQQGRDFVVSYSNNVNVGQGTVTIQGIGKYTGTIVTSFNIIKDEFNGNGTYEIQSAVNTNKVFDITDGSNSGNVRVQVYDRNSTMAQQFNIVKNQNGYYTIQNVGSELYVGIDVGVNSINNGNYVVQGIGKNSKAAQFIIMKNSVGKYIFISAWDKNYVLDLSDGKAVNGKKIQLYSNNGTNAQAWNLVKVTSKRDVMNNMASQYKDTLKDGKYYIASSLNTSYVLDVSDGSTNNGANVQLYSKNGTDAQGWIVTHDQKGYVTFTCVKSGKVLDVKDALGRNYQNVQQYQSNYSWAQKWILMKEGNTFKIASAVNTDYVLDLSDGKVSSGKNIQIFSSNNSKAQRWVISEYVTELQRIQNLASSNKNVLKDGTYYIQSSLNSGYVLDVSDGSTGNGANIQLYQSNGTYAQAFEVSHDESGFVTFKNVKSGKVLDVNDGKARNGQNVWQYGSNSTYAQKWIVRQDGTIISALNTNYVLDLSDGIVRNRKNIQVYSSNGTNAQHWKFTKFVSERDKLDEMAKVYNADITEGTYTFISTINTNYAMDVYNGSNGNGANVQMYTSNKTNAQKWTIKKDSKGYISFIHYGTNKALDVSDGVVQNGKNVWQYGYNGTYAQKWILKKNNDGTYTFVSALNSNYVLDVSEGKVRNGANVQLYTSNGTNAQKFKLTKV